MTPELHGLMTFAVIFLAVASVLFVAGLVLFARAINLVWAAYWAAHQAVAKVVSRG